MKEDRLKELFQIAKPDHLSVLYLKLLLNIKPDDTNLRAELVRHYLNLGELDEARAALEPLLPKNGTGGLERQATGNGNRLPSFFICRQRRPKPENEAGSPPEQYCRSQQSQASSILVTKILLNSALSWNSLPWLRICITDGQVLFPIHQRVWKN